MAYAALVDMKTTIFTAVACLYGALGLGAFRASAEFEVSAGVSIQASSDFYEPLAADGAWVAVGSYGRCWHPSGVVAGWRPYCQGYWEWTDCGWYWESDEPWAWACYHYGTWVYDPNYGWVWVPGIEWAPAWVYWRTGGDYIGWAPCGPSGFVMQPSYYVFVEGRHFNDRVRPDTVIVNNTTIIKQTTEIRNVAREQVAINGRSQTAFVNHGPSVAAVERASGHKFNVVPIQKADQVTARAVPEKLRHQESKPAASESRPPANVKKAGPTIHEPAQSPDRHAEGQGNHQSQPPRTSPGVAPEEPRHTAPRPETPPDRTIPKQSPPDRAAPIVPPGQPQPQAPHPQHPQAPPNPPGQDKDKGHDKDQHS